LAAQGIASTVFSITSWSELAREGQAWERASDRIDKTAEEQAALQASRQAAHQADAGAAPADEPAPAALPYAAQLLQQGRGPIVAASDYVRAVPESIRACVPAGRAYVTLGTDGFGRSDTRSALREFFGVDAAHIARAALRRCADAGA
ncbi:MAG: transketolase-like TK C-terminal-containing protein, partial [Rubrivivax sp.]